MHEQSDLARLEKRLRALEDAEAIRNLKAQYAALCDDHYNAEGIAALFAEDAVGRARTSDALKGEKRFATSFKAPPACFPLPFITA